MNKEKTEVMVFGGTMIVHRPIMLSLEVNLNRIGSYNRVLK